MWKLICFEEITSTNDEARGAVYAHGDVIVAGRQTAGRGQRGNAWHSEPGKNLTFSVVLEPSFLAAANQFLLSEAVSLAVADTLDYYGIMAEVKWPNDIYVGGRKIAGILIENDITGNAVSRSVAGIGLNVNQMEFDPTLPYPTSMNLETGRDFDRREVLSRFLSAFMARYETLRTDAETIANDYHKRLYRRGIAAQYILPDGSAFVGTLRCVMPGGELIVQDSKGQAHCYLFKEIEFARETL